MPVHLHHLLHLKSSHHPHQLFNLDIKMENRPSSNSSSTTTLFDDKFTDLEKLPDPSQEPRRRWVSIMIMAMLGLLLLATGGGLIVSGLVFGHRVTVDGQCASQSFVLFAVSSPCYSFQKPNV